MRGTRAKALRKQDPSRPNPGRLGGGNAKEGVRETSVGPHMWFKGRARAFRSRDRVVGRYAKR